MLIAVDGRQLVDRTSVTRQQLAQTVCMLVTMLRARFVKFNCVLSMSTDEHPAQHCLTPLSHTGLLKHWGTALGFQITVYIVLQTACLFCHGCVTPVVHIALQPDLAHGHHFSSGWSRLPSRASWGRLVSCIVSVLISSSRCSCHDTAVVIVETGVQRDERECNDHRATCVQRPTTVALRGVLH
ncbi:uncharacterized protein LAESUDRAFT_225646 [Laetiporus sulphureus 93-53]|uniref:Uncharacterized protein n=1 Tax=Laetiporus sulphureus 93-53 TaxID=1314785 RepID=A0A165DPL9_9APHY|nr:uncharacterized protein LAESUDRAFT_225646 [Laetiporus sulphureus 93-53]KZT05346.1 hypothetical protein LAESUDRAFT_225646 [Laetiporus sulphureus 93-53]